MTRTRFEILNKIKDYDGGATSLLEKFVKYNEETSNLLIPKKENIKINIISAESRIIVARDKVNVAFIIYSKKYRDNNQDNLRHAEEKLQSEYDNIASEELESDIQRIMQANKLSKYATSWKLINKIT